MKEGVEMVFINDSLNVMLVGDWNKLYIQPDWIATNVFEKDEIQIGVNGEGSEFSVSYRADGITIAPTQSKIIFSVWNTDEESLEKLSVCLNNFLEKVHIPTTFVYGINGDFVEDDDSLFAEVLDGMSDSNILIENGYQILSTQVTRTLVVNEKIINMESNLENARMTIHFNEHHVDQDKTCTFNTEMLNGFIRQCRKIVLELGYQLEGDE